MREVPTKKSSICIMSRSGVNDAVAESETALEILISFETDVGLNYTYVTSYFSTRVHLKYQPAN